MLGRQVRSAGDVLRRRWAAAALAAAASAWVAQVHAATDTWTGSTNSVWATATNWTPSGPPGSGDTAVFSTGQKNQTPTLASATTATVGQLNFTTSGWTINGTGTAPTLTLNGVSGIGILNSATSGTNDIGSTMKLALGATQTWEVAAGGTLEVDAVISGAFGLTLGTSGFNGTVNLTGNNTFSGGLTVAAGTLELNSGGRVNGGAITFDAGTTLLLNADTNAITPSVAINGNMTITQSSGTSTSITGALSGSGNITINTVSILNSPNANEFVVLNSASSTYSGAITVASGNLQMTQPVNTAASVTLDNGTMLLLGNSTTLSITSANGGIIVGGGAAATVAITAGGTPTVITTPITGGGSGASLTLGGSFGSNFYVGAAPTFYSGTANLQGASTFAGTVNFDAPTELTSGGTLSSATAYTLNAGGSLTIDNTSGAGGNVNNRLNSTAPLQFGGGTLVYNGSDVSASTGGVGATTLAVGPVSTLTVTANGNATTFTTPSITHSAGGSALFVNGTNLGTGGGTLVVTAAPALVGTTPGTGSDNIGTFNTQIVPFMLGEVANDASGTPAASGAGSTLTGTANTFVSYNAATGAVRPLNPTDEFVANISDGSGGPSTAGDNVYIQSSQAASMTGNLSINSLVINGAATSDTPALQIPDGTTLTNASGALLFVTSGSIVPSGSTGTLGFGAVEPIITVNTSVTATISTPITGSKGLTDGGGGTLILAAANPGLSGAVTVNGTLQFGTGNTGGDGTLPGATGYTLSNNGSLVFDNTAAQTIGVPITYTPNSGGVRLSSASIFFQDPAGVTLSPSASNVTAPTMFVSGPLNVNGVNVNSYYQFFTGWSNTISPLYSSVNLNGGSISASAAYIGFNTQQPTANAYLGITGGGSMTVQNPNPAMTSEAFFAGNFANALVEVGQNPGNPTPTTGTINFATNSTNSNTPGMNFNAGTNTGGSHNSSQYSELNIFTGGSVNIGIQPAVGVTQFSGGGSGGINAGYVAGQNFVLNVVGGSLNNFTGNGPVYVDAGIANSASGAGFTAYSIVNVDSDANGNVGKLITAYLRALPNPAQTAGAATQLGSTGAFLNFNGGEVEYNNLSASGTIPGPGNGIPNNGWDGGVFVFPKGAIVGTNALESIGAAPPSGTTSLNHPLMAPIGESITSIPITDGGSGYQSPPMVQITDGSTGAADASAVATITNGVLTAITITSPGVNYASPSITLIGGNPTTAATIGTPTLAALPNTGGFTKVDNGTLISQGGYWYSVPGDTAPSNGNLLLAAQNTYGGPTTVVAGTLQLNGVYNETNNVIIETNTATNAAVLQINQPTSLNSVSSTTSPAWIQVNNNVPLAAGIVVGDVPAGTIINGTTLTNTGTFQISATGTAGFSGFALAGNQVLSGFGSVKGTSTLGLNIGQAPSGTVAGAITSNAMPNPATPTALTGSGSVISPGYMSSGHALVLLNNTPYFEPTSPYGVPIVVGVSGQGTPTVTFNSKQGNAAGLAGNNATGALTLGNGTTMTTTLGGDGTYLWKLDLSTGGAGGTTVPGTAQVSPGITSGAPAVGTAWDQLVLDNVALNGTLGTTAGGSTNAFTVEGFAFPSGTLGTPVATTNGGSSMSTTPYSWVIARVNQPYNAGNAATLLASLSLDTTNLPAPATGYQFFLTTQQDPGANDTDLVVNYAPTPEPTALFLLAPAAGGLMLRRRRRV